jgi:hypothetical protein
MLNRSTPQRFSIAALTVAVSAVIAVSAAACSQTEPATPLEPADTRVAHRSAQKRYVQPRLRPVDEIARHRSRRCGRACGNRLIHRAASCAAVAGRSAPHPTVAV